MAEVCKSDLKRLVKYLDDAADLYGKQHGQRYIIRAQMIKRLANKLRTK